MHPFVKNYFTPWKYPTPMARFIGFLTLITLPLSVLGLVVSWLLLPMLVLLVIGTGCVIVEGVKSMRESRRLHARLVHLLAARMVTDGDIEMHELPPDIQEGIQIEHTRYRLSRTSDEQ